VAAGAADVTVGSTSIIAAGIRKGVKTKAFAGVSLGYNGWFLMVKSEDDRAFVQTMIDLAHRLGLKTVAEWVQDEEAAALLAGWGCDYLQGALIGLATTERPWSDGKDRAANG
jgi:hypothetical protein